jgi:TonB family protein
MFEQETYERKRHKENTLDEKVSDERDFAQKIAAQPLTPKSARFVVSGSRERTPSDPKQRQLMLAALALLMVALCFVLYRDRDFWFPDGQEAQLDEPAATTPAAAAPAATEPVTSSPVASTSLPAPVAPAKHHTSVRAHANTSVVAREPLATPAETDPPPAVVTNRTVLPPLNVEVVAGDKHRTIRPGTNSVRVDLEPGAKPQTTTQPTTEVPASAATTTDASETAATVTSSAAERVQMSADTEEMVSHPVKPGYPTLARQMKVQGSVILRALIGKDGIIQDLQLVSGPRILAAAAEDAVRQWHFKPHYIDSEAVETQAKITVNFTISTN